MENVEDADDKEEDDEDEEEADGVRILLIKEAH
jgi:hypothetical protein